MYSPHPPFHPSKQALVQGKLVQVALISVAVDVHSSIWDGLGEVDHIIQVLQQLPRELSETSQQECSFKQEQCGVAWVRF